MVGKADEIIVWLTKQDREALFNIKEYKKKELRRLTQNALYWEFLQRLASKLRIGKAECHNLMLRRYGQRWFTQGGELIAVLRPDTEEEARRILSDEVTHLIPTDEIAFDKDGQKRVYHLLKGSSVYTTEEMSVLIDGLIRECNDQGIDTTRLQDRQLIEREANAKKHYTESEHKKMLAVRSGRDRGGAPLPARDGEPQKSGGRRATY